jgi:hypothetical protein
MSRISGFRRFAAVVLSGSLLAATLAPVQAQPIPMSRSLADVSAVEQVQYRPGPRHYRPPYVARRKRGNGGAAAAAAAIGALAIGAAIIASQNQRREPVYYGNPGYDPRYAADPYAYEEEVYYPQPAPRRRWHDARRQAIDPGSSYAIEQERARHRWR